MTLTQQTINRSGINPRQRLRYPAIGIVVVLLLTLVVQAARIRADDTGDLDVTAPVLPPAATAVAVFESRVAAKPDSFVDFVNLGEAQLRLARETSDTSAYLRADEAARRAIAINPSYAPARLLQANVRLALHDFRGALDMAEPLAESNNPGPALAITFDAQLALGEYGDAEATLARLDELASGPSLLVRQQGLLDVQGRYQEAIQMAEDALEQARAFGLGGEALAWYMVNTAELHLRYGNSEAADELFAGALGILPAHAPALGGRGRAALAEGRWSDAVEWLEQAVAVAPHPDILIALMRAGELRSDAGLAQEASAQLDAFVQLALAGENLNNRVLGLYLVDLGDIDAALQLAEREAAVRSDIYTWDTLAWARLAAGDVSGAMTASEAALANGAQDPLILYHAGVIQSAAGNGDQAKELLGIALTINPAFDPLHAPRTAALLADVGGS